MREERERQEQLLEEERTERRRPQEELDAERGKGFWQRLFGGADLDLAMRVQIIVLLSHY